MTNTKISTQIGARIPNELNDALVAFAEEERRTIGWVVRAALEDYLKRAERNKKRRKAP